MKYRNFNPTKYKIELTSIYKEILARKKLSAKSLRKILSKYPKDKNGIFSKDELIAGFQFLKKEHVLPKDSQLPEIIVKKPTRSISGVTTLTLLTKPFACPGKCIFCPNDIRMPKSYIATEPGAQRAIRNRFDPYIQSYNRLKALHLIGHPTEKIEVLVLGGTWSYYPETYQVWFIKEIFRALNDFDPDNILDIEEKDYYDIKKSQDINTFIRKNTAKESYNELIKTKEYKDSFDKYVSKGSRATWADLKKEQERNINSKSKCVGLVLETRPDTLTPKEVLKLRKFGATKIQIGVQTLDPKVNFANKRLETKSQIANGFNLLRLAGFKIHAHMMPNLYKATLESDTKSYHELFNSKNFKPDELKIYPTSVIADTGLSKLYKEGKYTPYETEELINLLAKFMEMTPQYCRLTRIIRDIPSQEILGGNKYTNLRQLVEKLLERQNRDNPNIRAREIKNKKIILEDLKLSKLEYETKYTKEIFMQYITKDQEIAGFLRLSLPKNRTNQITCELNNSAIIREVHVYGPTIDIGKMKEGKAQHIGLGSKLIEEAHIIAKKRKYSNLAVISAIGTISYYAKQGFLRGQLYQHKSIN